MMKHPIRCRDSLSSRLSPIWLVLVHLLILSHSACSAQAPRSLFDPNRHMRVADVKPGMKGYGLTVFSGTKIEKFDVEVISVMHNFNPQADVVLINCKGAQMEHTGSVAGMSGSPIYLFDQNGKEKMIGAFAYGWNLCKDPLAGVQPIEYMLEIPEPSKTEPAGGKVDATNDGAKKIHWSLGDAQSRVRQLLRPQPIEQSADSTKMRPLSTPLAVSGLGNSSLEQFAPMLRSHGLEAIQSGSAPFVGTLPEIQLEPGSVISLPILNGDLDLSAVGTVTEIIDGRVFAFGHPFEAEGPTSLPMASGQVHTIVASITSSFKLGATAQVRGVLNADSQVGVAGRIGEKARTVPIEFKVKYTDGSFERTYKFESAIHPTFTPMVTAMAMESAITGAHNLPRYHTLAYSLNLEFEDGETIAINNRIVNANSRSLASTVALPMVAMSDNPFKRVAVAKVGGTITVTPVAQAGTIIYASVPKLKYKPGETIKAFATIRPFRAADENIPFEFTLPSDLTDGQYRLVVSDSSRYLSDRQQNEPFRFLAESSAQVMKVIREATSFRDDAIYVRLDRNSDGVAVGRTALDRLPGTRRTILLASGRSNTAPFTASTTKIIPTDRVLSGSAEFMLTIERENKLGANPAAHPMPMPVAPNHPPIAPPQGSGHAMPGEID